MKTTVPECISCPAVLFCETGTLVLFMRCDGCESITHLGFKNGFGLPFGYCCVSEFDSEFVRAVSVCLSTAARSSFKLAAYAAARSSFKMASYTGASRCLECSPRMTKGTGND
jgi:hypothetical protein